MKDEGPSDPWGDDLLRFRELGHTFSNLVRSFDEGKVISIEAGYGRGKTFFRKRWAQELEAAGEVVIQLDAQKSDHSGDPVVTFMGALVAALPEQDQSHLIKAWGQGKALFWGTAKVAANVAARQAGSEAVEKLETYLGSDGDVDATDQLITEFGKGLSKAFSAQVSAQLSAERIRLKEMPEQLDKLRQALTGKEEGGRIIILIDELDRCHPDYALALLEAMKLVFDQPGFVFVLMVNADYLERIAEHRFGQMEKGERYLEKFVDMRLALPRSDEALSAAIETLAMDLPLEIPLGDHKEFSVARAARLAGELAPQSGLSMRQLKRLLLRVEITLRCYKDEPIDCALLVWLAFQKAYADIRKIELPTSALPRAGLPQDLAEVSGEDMFGKKKQEKILAFVRENCMELNDLPDDRYFLPDEQKYHWWAKIGVFLAPNYIPRHQAMLDAIYQIEAK